MSLTEPTSILQKRQDDEGATTEAECDIDTGDITFIILSSALVLIMIPGLGYFYSGLARHKNALSMLFLCMTSLAVVTVQWFLFGYSLSFGPSGGPFIGTFEYGVLTDVDGSVFDCSTGGISHNLFMIFQGLFAAITPALAFGAVAERARILPLVVFLFIWTTIVYDPITYWTWAGNGWLLNLGSLDAAGGTPVHVNSGAAALALALVLGKRKGHGIEEWKPHNLSTVFLGTALLWFGWFGFNGGSILSANARAVNSIIVTNMAACCGALTWVALDYATATPKQRKWSAFGFCAGAVAGLVTITPASGYVSVASSIVFGVVGASCCWSVATYKLKILKPFDDALDVFAVHGVGGMVGNILTGVFAQQSIAAMGGSEIDGGWLDGNFAQIGPQFAGGFAGFAWSFVVTFIVAFVMNKIPYLHLRVKEEHEDLGVDIGQFGISAYEYVNTMPGADLKERSIDAVTGRDSEDTRKTENNGTNV